MTRFIKKIKALIMPIIFYSHYIYFLSFKLFFKIIKLINKFNIKSHLIWNAFSLIKKNQKNNYLIYFIFKNYFKEQ